MEIRWAENYEKQAKSKENNKMRKKNKQIFKNEQNKQQKIYATMRIHKLQLKQPYTHSHIQE